MHVARLKPQSLASCHVAGACPSQAAACGCLVRLPTAVRQPDSKLSNQPSSDPGCSRWMLVSQSRNSRDIVYRNVTSSGVPDRCGTSLNPSSENRDPLNRKLVRELLRTRQLISRAAIEGARRQHCTATPMGPPDVNAAKRRPLPPLRLICNSARSARSRNSSHGSRPGSSNLPSTHCETRASNMSWNRRFRLGACRSDCHAFQSGANSASDSASRGAITETRSCVPYSSRPGTTTALGKSWPARSCSSATASQVSR